jgi:hypothetical protein
MTLRPFTAELAEHAEAYLGLRCVLSVLGREKLSLWERQGLEHSLS